MTRTPCGVRRHAVIAQGERRLGHSAAAEVRRDSSALVLGGGVVRSSCGAGAELGSSASELLERLSCITPSTATAAPVATAAIRPIRMKTAIPQVAGRVLIVALQVPGGRGSGTRELAGRTEGNHPMSNPMSGDQNMFDKAKEATKGLKDKLTGKGRPEDEQEPGVPGEVPQGRDESLNPPPEDMPPGQDPQQFQQ